jgi:hypothetical protein
MMRTSLALSLAVALTGCGVSAPQRQDAGPAAAGPVAVVASPLEPAAQFNGSNASYAEGALLGAAGGAGYGALSAHASAGLLCTIGGPLCLAVVVPVAVVGGVVGGVAGAAMDAITTDPFGRTANARVVIEQALADMRLTDGLAAKTSQELNLPLAKAMDAPAETVLEVGVSDLQILAREKDMALLLRGRSRLVHVPDGRVLEERVSETQTEFRKYRDWAADEARPLRRALDDAIAKLGRSLLSARPESRLRADTSAPLGG